MKLNFSRRPAWVPGPMTLFLLAFLQVAGAESVTIPGTTVAMEPPPGFSVSDRFSGLENRETGSTMMIVELPADAYQEMASVMATVESASKAWASRGVAITGVTRIYAHGSEIPIATGTQTAGGRTMTKYMALFGGDKTVLVSLNVRNPPDITQAHAEGIMASITLRHAPSLEDEIAALPFTFRTVEPFHVDQVLGGSNVLLTITESPDPSGMSPVVVITRALEPADSSDPAVIGERLIRGTTGFQSLEIADQASVSFAGDNGHYLKAVVDGRTAIQFLNMPDDRRYIRLVAMGETAAMQQVLPAVDEIARSVRVAD